MYGNLRRCTVSVWPYKGRTLNEKKVKSYENVMKSMLSTSLATAMKFFNVCQLVDEVKIVSYYNKD